MKLYFFSGSIDAVEAVLEGNKFDDIYNFVKNEFSLKIVERWGNTHNVLVAAAYGMFHLFIMVISISL